MNRVNETCLEQFLNLSLDGYCFPRINWTNSLSNKLSIRIHCDLMFSYFRIDIWNFLIRLGKNVAELFEKIHINVNIFGGEIHPDEDILHDMPGFREMLIGIVAAIVAIFPSA
jgi:hypothetical protein